MFFLSEEYKNIIHISPVKHWFEFRSLRSYKLQCSSWNANYYGETKRHFKVRVSEHIGVSARTGKNTKSTKNSAVCDHMLVCNNTVSFEDFSVLANRTNGFRIKLQESILIHRDGPQSSKTSESASLMLFSQDISYL